MTSLLKVLGITLVALDLVVVNTLVIRSNFTGDAQTYVEVAQEQAKLATESAQLAKNQQMLIQQMLPKPEISESCPTEKVEIAKLIGGVPIGWSLKESGVWEFHINTTDYTLIAPNFGRLVGSEGDTATSGGQVKAIYGLAHQPAYFYC